jgi:hypothetical protein
MLFRTPLARAPQSKTPQAYGLHYGSARTPLLLIVPDSNWPGMYRVHWPDWRASDMANLSRARDAAFGFARRSVSEWRLLRWRPTRGAARKPLVRSDDGVATPLAAGAQT